MIFAELLQPLATIFSFIGKVWWLWLPIILFFLALAAWLDYRRKHWIKLEGDWVMLEIHSPREVEKSSKAMEQFFANLHGLRNAPGNFYEKWWDGEIPLWHSLEIAGIGGRIHFYLRTPRMYQRAATAYLHAQYPDAEVTEVSDYMDKFPQSFEELSQQKYKLFGTELVLEKDDAYPLRTYVEFESHQEEQNLDTIGALLEMMGKLKPGENLFVQVLVRSVGPEWQEAGKKLVEKLREKYKVRTLGAEGQEHEYYTMASPGDIELMKAIERNISKFGFQTLIRYIYLAPEEIYTGTVFQRGGLGVFNQFGTTSMNRFRHNYLTWTYVKWPYFPYFFPRRRLNQRRKMIYKRFRERKISDEGLYTRLTDIRPWNFTSLNLSTFVLNTEELATIFHLPTKVITTAPMMKKVESRRVGPPVGLDIFQE